MITLFMTNLSGLASEADWQALIERARLAAADGYLADAERSLSEAVTTEDGRIDPEAWYLLARTRISLADLDGARLAADRANVYARDDDQAAVTADLMLWLQANFGTLLVVPPPGTLSDLTVEPVVEPFDPALQAWITASQAAIEQPIDGPRRIGVPIGAWQVNGKTVDVQPDHVVFVRLARPSSAFADVHVGVGAAVLGWTADGSNLPAPAGHLRVDAPVGPVRLGFESTMGVVPWTTASGAAVRAGQFEFGPRIAVSPWSDTGLIADVVLSLRLGTVPGIPRACTETESGWACSEGTAHGLVTYPSATALTPGLDVELGWLHPTAPSAFGVVGSVGAGWAMGRLPAEAHADRIDGAASVPYTLDDRSWNAPALRGVLGVLFRP